MNSTKIRETKKWLCVVSRENHGLKKSGCKIVYLCRLQCHRHGVSHVNVIFSKIAATAADRRTFALGFILKAVRGKCIPACLFLEQYHLKYLHGNGDALLYGLFRLLINGRNHISRMIDRLLWSVNHLVWSDARIFLSNGSTIFEVAARFSMTGGSVIISQFYFPVTEFPHLLAGRMRERGASFWR